MNKYCIKVKGYKKGKRHPTPTKTLNHEKDLTQFTACQWLSFLKSKPRKAHLNNNIYCGKFVY